MGIGFHVLYYAEDGVVRCGFHVPAVRAGTVTGFHHTATDCLGGAEELDSKAAGDDDTVLGTLCRQRFGRRTTLDGGQAQRPEVALLQRKELGVGTTSAVVSASGAKGGEVDRPIPVA